MSAGSDSVVGVHTPGPWRTVEGNLIGAKGRRVEFSGSFGFAIGSVSGRPDRVANSRLAIAAPELLEALEQFIAALDAFRGNGEFPDFDEWEAKARAALAKARSPQ